MADQTEEQGMGTAVSRREGDAADSPLRSERGMTSIARNVVEKVAGLAAREVAGVAAMGSGRQRAVGAVTSRVGASSEESQGVGVEVGEREAAVDLILIVEYGESIPQVANRVRDNVIRRIEGITGLSVTEVNIEVVDLDMPHGEGESERTRVE